MMCVSDDGNTPVRRQKKKRSAIQHYQCTAVVTHCKLLRYILFCHVFFWTLDGYFKTFFLATRAHLLERPGRDTHQRNAHGQVATALRGASPKMG